MANQVILTSAGGGPVSTATSGLSDSAKGLMCDSLSANTRAAYQCGLNALGRAGLRIDAMDDAGLANALAAMADAGASPASCRVAAAAAAKVSGLMGKTNPRGSKTAAILQGIGRRHRSRGRGQAAPLDSAAAAAIVATAHQRRPAGRGMESQARADARAKVDIAIVGLLFHAGLRRSEAAALRWSDVSAAKGGITVSVRTSKTNQDGGRADVRFVAGDLAAAVLGLRGKANDGDSVLGLSGASIARRLKAAAKAAGLKGIKGHSGRVGLATELIRRGASTADVARAGGWKSTRMVAHYAAGARAESGAVARYL